MRTLNYKQREETLARLDEVQRRFESEGFTDEVINQFREIDCGNLKDIPCDECPALELCDKHFEDEEEIEEDEEVSI